MFIIEGSITIGIALIAFVYLPRPGRPAWFLNEEEKWWSQERMLRDTRDGQQAKAGISWVYIKEGLKDWKVCELFSIIPPVEVDTVHRYRYYVLAVVEYPSARAYNLLTYHSSVSGICCKYPCWLSSGR